MLNLPRKSSGKSKDEPEKPFWISYADQMTALMFLFLSVMVVSILSISHEVNLATVGEKKQKF